MIDRDEVENFAQKFHCGLEVMGNGEHWFHSAEQIEVCSIELIRICIKIKCVVKIWKRELINEKSNPLAMLGRME